MEGNSIINIWICLKLIDGMVSILKHHPCLCVDCLVDCKDLSFRFHNLIVLKMFMKTFWKNAAVRDDRRWGRQHSVSQPRNPITWSNSVKSLPLLIITEWSYWPVFFCDKKSISKKIMMIMEFGRVWNFPNGVIKGCQTDALIFTIYNGLV